MTILIFTCVAIIVYWINPKRWRKPPDAADEPIVTVQHVYPHSHYETLE